MHRFGFSIANRVLATLVNRFSPKETLFDIGGGNGCVSRDLECQGFDVVLLEPGREGVLNAKKRGLAQIIQASMEEAAFNPSFASVGGHF